jgi:hypothetical protein
MPDRHRPTFWARVCVEVDVFFGSCFGETAAAPAGVGVEQPADAGTYCGIRRRLGILCPCGFSAGHLPEWLLSTALRPFSISRPDGCGAGRRPLCG